MNKAWHAEHPLARNATDAQRMAWHFLHQEACGCRPMPAGLRARMLAVLGQTDPGAGVGFQKITEIPSGIDFLSTVLPKDRKRVLVYLPAVNLRSGTEKLQALIAETLGAPPQPWDAYVFVNKARNTALVYWLASDGERTIERHLSRGGFILPTNSEGQHWAQIEPAKLRRLLR